MSHQLSTVDNIKDTANSAYETVTNTVAPAAKGDYDPNKDKTNFKKDAYRNTVKKGDLKDKLNEAALGGPSEREESYVEKGMLSLKLCGTAAKVGVDMKT
jgi:hypothetical protein